MLAERRLIERLQTDALGQIEKRNMRIENLTIEMARLTQEYQLVIHVLMKSSGTRAEARASW